MFHDLHAWMKKMVMTRRCAGRPLRSQDEEHNFLSFKSRLIVSILF
jgi:hypothetical protein